MKTYLITIEGPGSEGNLEYVMDESEYKAFELFIKEWNDNNCYHSSPYIMVTESETA